MRYAGIIKDDINNGRGIGLTLFTQGCTHHCPHCQNPETWGKNGGSEFTPEILEDIVKYFKEHKYATRLTLSGGDPLDSLELTTLVLTTLKKEIPYLQVWLYTGYIFEDISNNPLLQYIDILVDGPFRNDLRDITLKFRGSSNQRLINVQDSLKTGEIVLYE